MKHIKIFNEGWFSKKWAIHNLTDEEIKYLRENSDKDDHSFLGI